MVGIITFSFSLGDDGLNKYKVHMNPKPAIQKGSAKAGYIHFVLIV